MSQYLQDAKEVRKLVDDFVKDHPSVANDPRFAYIAYNCLKPRAFRSQGIVKRGMIRAVFGHLFKMKEENRTDDRTGKTFQVLKIYPKDPHKENLFTNND